MICKCEFKSYASLGTHLWKTHQMDSREYYDKYLKKDGEGICPICKKGTSFKSLGQGYKTYCSRKCAAVDIASDRERNSHKVNAMRDTFMREHGVTNAAQLQSVKDKRKATMRHNYGVDYYSQVQGFGDMCKETNLKRYGVPSYIMLPEFQERLRSANMKSIGVPYNYCKKTDEAVDEYTRLLAEHGCTLVEFIDKKHIKYRCNTCNSEMTEQDLFIKGRIGYKMTPCSVCCSKDSPVSNSEKQLDEFIRSLGFETTHYDRNFLGVYGADIVVEEKKVIFEYDGLYWHSEVRHDRDYHLMKTELAEEKGYHLIHIFSDEWETKQDLVKSRIRAVLGVNHEKVYARNCEIRELDAKTAGRFIEENHIQGDTVCSMRYGLFFNDTLVAAMTLGGSRFAGGTIELIRYCTLPNIAVVGGAGKLFNYFVTTHPDVDRVISYADRRWSSKNSMYAKIGFRLDGTSEPSYYYTLNGVRYNRMVFMKYKLVADGFDKDKSEREIMAERGYVRIYDCGTYRFVWERDGHHEKDSDHAPEMPTEPELVRYNDLVKPFGCTAIGIKYGKNVLIHCNKCGADSKVFGPLLEMRIAHGVQICTKCAENADAAAINQTEVNDA